MSETRIEHAEHVLPGHPDKLCDAAVDAIVEQVRALDPGAHCALEAACVFETFHLTGGILADPAALDRLDPEALIRETYRRAGYGADRAGFVWGPAPEDLAITSRLWLEAASPGRREELELSDDQAVCVGYATDDPETGHLPPAVWLSRRLARALFGKVRGEGAGQAGPDGKVLVRVERRGRAWRPLSISVSLSHHEDPDGLFLRRLAEDAVGEACAGLGAPELRVNGAGPFVSPGPNGDNGLSGKKLVVDAYGPAVPIGGGAWSGKDLRKVDRLGGLLARALAVSAVRRALGREVTVWLEYRPGSGAPEGVLARIDDRYLEGAAFLRRLGDPGLGNVPAWERFRACPLPLPELALWGHQRPGAPWERPFE